MGTVIAILICLAIWALVARLNTALSRKNKKVENKVGLLQCPLCIKPMPQRSQKLIRGASGKLFVSNFCRLCFMKPKPMVSPEELQELARTGMIDPASERPSFLRRLLRRSARGEATKAVSKTDTKEMKAYIRQFKRELACNHHSRLCWVLEEEWDDSEESHD